MYVSPAVSLVRQFVQLYMPHGMIWQWNRLEKHTTEAELKHRRQRLRVVR